METFFNIEMNEKSNVTVKIIARHEGSVDFVIILRATIKILCVFECQQ